MRFTKALRKEIVTEFASRHGGTFDPAGFLAEVKKAGAKHPAHSWFEWSDKDAAEEFRLEQARSFASDLRITFSVEEIGRNRTITVVETTAPLVVSPIGNRNSGGGYFLFDPSNPKHQKELCQEASSTLQAWLKRYRAALGFVGLEDSAFVHAIAAMDSGDPSSVAAE